MRKLHGRLPVSSFAVVYRAAKLRADMRLGHFRRDYGTGSLRRQELAGDPIAQFQGWFRQASGLTREGRWRRVGIALYKLWQALLGRPPLDANAMALATVSVEGQPSVRTVLLKGVDARGFVFFTNYDSRKGRELAANPRAALVFYWPDWERQVCITGTVSKLPREESEAYFKTRPRGAQLAAWASNQSDVIPNREALEARWQEMARRFEGADVPLPPNWGGYVLAPEQIEFWQGRLNRLHDRFRYSRQPDGTWRVDRLCP
ncbi:MAG: pyridoxamine 5'-phosphate oxidase [Verrucomicrobiales bacterium]|nr:pyridoxamine 5'-phosphate oxidase [Verrucomicrobiales bacterium]